MTAKLTIADYPLAETRSDKIRGPARQVPR